MDDPLDELKDIKPEEVNFLASIVKRAYQSVVQPGEVIFLLSGDRRLPSPKKLRVATFAFDLPDPRKCGAVKSVPGLGQPRLGPKSYNLVVYSEDSASFTPYDLVNLVDRFLADAVEREQLPHFVLLNELSLSFEKTVRENLVRMWAGLAQKYQVYIVPGTYHSTEEYYGVAEVFSPDASKNRSILKQNAAIRQDESIRTPDSRELFVLETDYGRIVLWICLDVYDPGLVLKFLSVTNRFSGSHDERRQPQREILLVLIPAFSGDSQENIEECVRSISRFSKTAVICCNAFPPDTGEPRRESYVFSCGEAVKELRSEPVKDTAGAQIGAVWLYEVDIERVREHQAQTRGREIFSSPFAAIIHGGGYRIREA